MTVDGRAVEIEPKPLQVLVHLLENAGKLVTKDALIQAVWPGRIIGDAALTKCVARLREAIGDRDQRLIKTHHRYGYRLITPVQTQGAAVPGPNLQPAPAVITPEPAGYAQETEHRPVTMLFCDLVGSTELAESLDPEAFRALLLDYQQRAAELARRYEGHVAQQFGDGMLIYFGYPSAHDDDAERAIRYAFDLLREQRAHANTNLEIPGGLSLRVGVHTGPLMIGPGPGGDTQATGASLHLASRLQALAEPDGILVTDATFRLVPGLFVTRDFGLQKFRGLSEPVRVHQVLQSSGVRSRLDVQARLTSFVGREIEIDLVAKCWLKSAEGDGRAILFSGEPGLGKSRLLMELRARLLGSPFTWLECRADPLNRHSAFHTVVELLRRGLALQDSDDDARRLQHLERALTDLDLDPVVAIPLLGPLLNIPATERYPASPLSPELKRVRTLDTFADWLERLSDGQPLVLAVEDLHWCDESSLDVIGAVLARVERLPLLLVMTARPEFLPPWPIAAPPLHAYSLDTLEPAEVERMLADLGDGIALAPALRRLILERAGGVPLFVEELLRSLRESGQLTVNEGRLEANVAAGDLHVPATLSSLLRARLDRLGSARELVQVVAVIGAECSYRQLQLVSMLGETDLRSQLASVVASGMLHARGMPPDASYVFKHALIRDSAYAALMKSSRQALHERAARAIEQQYAARLEEHFGELAHHYERSGHAELAASYAQRAGENAMRASANREAATHLGNAIRLTETLAASPARLQTLISLQVSLVNTLVPMRGYVAPEVSVALAHARDLCSQAGNAADLAPILFWIGALQLVRSEYAAAVDTFRQLERLGLESAQPPACVIARFGAAQGNALLGEHEAASAAAREAVEIYEREDCRDIAFVYGEDARASAQATLAWSLWLQGYPDQAAEQRRHSMQHARDLGHEYSLAIAGTLNAFGAEFARASEEVTELARQGAALSAEHGFPWYFAWCEILLAYAEGQRGKAAAAVTRIRTAMETFHGSGARILRPWALRALASAQGLAGHSAEALSTIAEALDAANEGEYIHLAEICRVRGELLLQASGGSAAREAEASFRLAIDHARSQSARSWELRAATSLARLLQRHGRGVEALATLEPVHAGFTEGFETPDLRDAATLLAELR